MRDPKLGAAQMLIGRIGERLQIERRDNPLAGFQSRDALGRMQVNRRIDVDGIDVRVLNQCLKFVIPLGDFVLITNLVQLFSPPLTNCIHVGVRMLLVNRDELLAES